MEPKDIATLTVAITVLGALIKGVWNAAKTLTTISDEIKAIRKLLGEGHERMDEHDEKLEEYEEVLDELDDTVESQGLKLNDHETRITYLEKKAMKVLTLVLLTVASLVLLNTHLLAKPHAETRWTSEMDSLAREIEDGYDLPHGICHAFALQESNCTPSATRVENGYFNQGMHYYNRIMAQADSFSAHHKWTDPVTERAYESISWGCWQIMGSNLRALGYDRARLPDILSDLPAQFELFAKFVSPLFRRYKTVARVAAAYNTGNPNRTGRSYDQHIVQYQKRFAY